MFVLDRSLIRLSCGLFSSANPQDQYYSKTWRGHWLAYNWDSIVLNEAHIIKCLSANCGILINTSI